MVTVEVAVEGGERPPDGATVVVQALDTTYLDTTARLVAEARGAVAATDPSESGDADAPDVIAAVTLDASPVAGADITVRAHVDVDGDGAVSPGDWLTTASYPLGGDPVRVLVRPV